MKSVCVALMCCWRHLAARLKFEKWVSLGSQPALCTVISSPKSYRLKPVLDREEKRAEGRGNMRLRAQALCIPGLMKLPSVWRLYPCSFYTAGGRGSCSQPSAPRDKMLAFFPIKFPALLQE